MGGLFAGGRAAQEPAPTLPRPQPDSRGVITYADYQVIVARDGDTVAGMARRVGLEPQALARHNGLPVTYSPRPGEQLALPGDVGGTPATATANSGGIWSTDIAASAIDEAERSGPSEGTATVAAGNPFDNGQQDAVIDPVRHRVQQGETAYSIARRYGVSVDALAEWNGLGPDRAIRTNQELLIPVSQDRMRQAPQQDTRQAAAAAPGQSTPIQTPPSAATPLPADENIDDAAPPASPDLGAQRSGGARFLTPVEGGSILRGYAPGGEPRNEGIDFAAPAGTPVRAADGGEVALISESLDGLGTIVLVRHSPELMTVYARITGVTLEKGDPVSRGQRLGVVADADRPNVHFEVRRGTNAVDPGPLLGL